MRALYDVAVVGAGVVGTAVARALVQRDLRVVLVEAGPDVGVGTSKANTAIWHTGFDAPPGSLEARLLRRAYPLLQEFVRQTGIAHERPGGLLVAWTAEQRDALPAIQEKAVKNGVLDLVPLDAAAVYAQEPHLGPGALGGLLIPGEGILCPYSPPLAAAAEAVINGADILLRSPVTRVEVGADWTRVQAGRQDLHCRWVVNAAGLHSDVVDQLLGFSRFTVTPRKGELVVFDKAARALVRHVILPVPTRTTKGVLVSPTVFGNVLLGPTAEDVQDKSDTATSERGLASLLEKGRVILPALLQQEVTATYAGLRAATAQADYHVAADRRTRSVVVGGIRSTGLSAALGLAEYVCELLEEAGVPLGRKTAWQGVRVPPLGERSVRPHADAALVRHNPDYGRLVCHCERVSLGELNDAMEGPLPATTLDGLRRRTRCTQGRCQGFHCLARVAQLLALRTGQDPAHLLGGEEHHDA